MASKTPPGGQRLHLIDGRLTAGKGRTYCKRNASDLERVTDKPDMFFHPSKEKDRCGTCAQRGKGAGRSEMTPEARAKAFNEANPVGTEVLFWPGVREGPGRLSVTNGEAWIMGGHSPVVGVVGHTGGIALSHIEAKPNPEARAAALSKVVHLLQAGPAGVDAECGLVQLAMVDSPHRYEGMDGYANVSGPERCPPCTAAFRVRRAASPLPEPAPTPHGGHLSYVDKWGVHGVSIVHPGCGCRIVGEGNSPDPVRVEPCPTHKPADDGPDTARKILDAVDAVSGRLNKAPPCTNREPVKGDPRRLACIARARTDRWGSQTTRTDQLNAITSGAMCEACAALWHVEQASAMLRMIARGDAMEEKERLRERAESETEHGGTPT